MVNQAFARFITIFFRTFAMILVAYSNHYAQHSNSDKESSDNQFPNVFGHRCTATIQH